MTGHQQGVPRRPGLAGVDFRLFPGEIHALMGENGAGKSTLIKVLTGVYAVDARHDHPRRQPVPFASPLQAQQAGISTVYQEVNLCPNLSVAENIFLGREPRALGRHPVGADAHGGRRAARPARPRRRRTAPLGSYPLAVQQLVAIVARRRHSTPRC